MRPYISPNFAGIHEPHLRKVVKHFDSALGELSIAASQAVGGAGGADTSGVVTGAGSGSSQASEFGRSLLGQDYLVINLDSTLINDRYVAAGAGITITDGGAKGALTIAQDSAYMDRLITGSTSVVLTDYNWLGTDTAVLTPNSGALMVAGVTGIDPSGGSEGTGTALFAVMDDGLSSPNWFIYSTGNIHSNTGDTTTTTTHTYSGPLALVSNSTGASGFTLSVGTGDILTLAGTGGNVLHVGQAGDIYVKDTSAAYNVKTVFTSSGALSAQRVLTINMADADRALTFPLPAFDSTVPADLASTAVAGTSAVIAERDHVHRFPTSLMEYTNSKKIALTSTTTISTLTSDCATVDLAGMTALRPGTTNALTLGASGKRYLAAYIGTSGIITTGGYTQSGSSTNTFTGNTTISGILIPSGGIAGSLSPSTDMGGSVVGDATHRWDLVSACQISMGDANIGPGTGNNYLVQATGSAATVDRTITYAYGDSDRTLTWSGNTTFPSGSAYTVTNPSTDRGLNVTGDTLAQGLAVLGTLIADLQAAGVIT